MRVEDIVNVEQNNQGIINLFRDKLFWRAWNRSAYLFSKCIMEYRVRHRTFKYIGKELIFLGFPDMTLDKIKSISFAKQYSVSILNESHITISGLPNISGYDEWSVGVLSGVMEYAQTMRNAPESRLSKEAYSLLLDVFNVVPKFIKDYKFSIGQRMMSTALDISEQAYAGKVNGEDINKLRMYFRVANELHQISDGWWHDAIKKIETVRMLGSASLRICGEACEAESSIPPGTPVPGYHHTEDS